MKDPHRDASSVAEPVEATARPASASWVGYTRTGSHNTRVHGRETGQWHGADLAVAHWLQHTSRDGDGLVFTTALGTQLDAAH